jgi:hypothetical protein
VKARVITAAEHRAISDEARRIDLMRLDRFAVAAEIKRTADRLKLPYRLLMARVVINEFDRSEHSEI